VKLNLNYSKSQNTGLEISGIEMLIGVKCKLNYTPSILNEG